MVIHYKILSTLIIALILNVKCSTEIKILESQSGESLARSFADIIGFLSENNYEVLIYNFNSDDQIIDEVMQSLHGEVPFKIKNFKGNLKNIALNRSALLIFDDIETLTEFNGNVTLTNQYPEWFTFFVYCARCSVADLLTLRERKLHLPITQKNSFNPFDRSEIIHYQYFLLEEFKDARQLVSLLTFEWYSPGKCDVQQISEVNQFNTTTNEWTSKFEIAKKFHNFHECELTFGVYRQPFFMQVKPPSKRKAFFGLHIAMINDLQRHLNYTVNYNLYEHGEFMDPELKVDMMLLLGCHNTHRTAKTFFTRTYIFQLHYMLTPPGESYTGYEKLLLPYDLEVWILIALTFVSAFTTIFILRFAPLKVRNFIIGQNVLTPSMNVASLFFGISQVTVPGRNFARFLVMVFILYSMIIRTAWQSKMFEFMQKEMTKPELKSIYEMMDKNYTLHMRKDFDKDFNGSDIANYENMRTNQTFEIIYERIFDPSSECGVHLTNHLLIYYAMSTNGEGLKRVLKEPFMVEFCGMEIPRSHKFFDVFNHKTEQLFVAGTIKYFYKMWEWYFDPNYYKKPKALHKEYLEDIYPRMYPEGPQVLTLVHLEAGFVIWLASFSLAFLGFVGEWIKVWIEYKFAKLIFGTFYDCKRSMARRNKSAVEARLRLARGNILKERERTRRTIKLKFRAEKKTRERHSTVFDLSLEDFRRIKEKRCVVQKLPSKTVEKHDVSSVEKKID